MHNRGLEQSRVITLEGVKKRNQSGTDYVPGIICQLVSDDEDVAAGGD